MISSWNHPACVKNHSPELANHVYITKNFDSYNLQAHHHTQSVHISLLFNINMFFNNKLPEKIILV